jgi:hypothetical protein
MSKVVIKFVAGSTLSTRGFLGPMFNDDLGLGFLLTFVGSDSLSSRLSLFEAKYPNLRRQKIIIKK